jgi:hypothetical protein
MALLLVILDAAIVHTREERSSLLIIKSDLPMMRLYDAGEGKTREDVASGILRGLTDDARLKEQFSIEHSTKPQGEEVKLENDESARSHAAVVHITDASEASIAEADNLARLYAAPLFIVPVSAEESIPDVSVNFVDCAGKASLDAPTTIHAILYGRGLARRSTVVKLSDEALVVASTVAHWEGNSETMTVPLSFIPDVEGLHRYTVKADAVGDELNTENNEISFSVDVRRTERRVLFIENQPTWEGKFIRRALEENRSIVMDYFAQVSRSAVLGQQQAQGSSSMQAIIGDFKRLADYDCIIIGPMDSSSMAERAARNLTAFVERRGGGLIILGGNDFNGSILSASSPLLHLIPAKVIVRQQSEIGHGATVENPESGSRSLLQGADASSRERAVDKALLTPTEEGREVFRMAGSNKPIEKLGSLDESYLRIQSLKAGAVAFAIDGSRKQPGDAVMIAAQPYGYGRTLLFAPSDSWKIGLAESEENKGALALLWQNLVTWAAAGAEPASSIRLHTSAVESGDTLRAYLVARDDSFNPVARLSIRSDLEFDESGKGAQPLKMPLTISHDPGVQGVYEINAHASGDGNAVLSVAVRFSEGGEQSLKLPFAIQTNRAAWRESPDNQARLRAIARASGGELFEAGELELLKSKLADIRSVPRAVTDVDQLRNSIALAFLLPLLMSLEYFLRKRYSAD